MNLYYKIDQRGNNDNEFHKNMVSQFSFTSKFCDAFILNKMDINYEKKCKINIKKLKMEKEISIDFKGVLNKN
jgi:hypothetical protein